MKKLFLSLDDAVRVAVKEFSLDVEDAEIVRREFEQKCYVTDDQYSIGYYDGIEDAIKAIKQKVESEGES